MSCDDISIGHTIATPCCDFDGPVVPAPGGRHILFCPDSPADDKFSRPFIIPEGRTFLLDAYNLPNNKPIYVRRVILSSTPPYIGDNSNICDRVRPYVEQAKVIFRAPMRLGGKDWKLCAPDEFQLLMTIPGTYQLELSDITMLGNLEVEYTIFANEDMLHYPFNYFAGQV